MGFGGDRGSVEDKTMPLVSRMDRWIKFNSSLYIPLIWKDRECLGLIVQNGLHDREGR